MNKLDAMNSNYPTWLVKNWLDENGQTRAAWVEQIRERTKGAPLDPETRERLVNAIADSMKEHIEKNAPKSLDIYSDLLMYAIQLVNWREIAEAFTLSAD